MAATGRRFLSKSCTFLALISLRRLSTAVVATIPAGASAGRKPPPAARFSVAEYLVQSCGLSEKDAEAASPILAHLRSPDKPDAVIRSLAERGLSRDEIAGIVSRRPRLLCLSQKSDITSKFDLLVSIGFSPAEVGVLLQKTNVLNWRSLCAVKKRVDFLRSIIGGDAAGMMKLIKRSAWVLIGGNRVERNIMDNVIKLRNWGVADERIKAFMIGRPRFFLLSSEIIDKHAAVAEGEFGISRKSKKFVKAVVVLSGNPEPARQSKYEVLESFGWKKSDIVALFRACPSFLDLGAAHLTKHLEFLMNKVGYTPACLAKCGSMLGMSLERRIIPRYELFCALKANTISSQKLTVCFYAFTCISEEDFQRKFVKEFMELEPDACKLYMSRCKSARELEHQ